MKNLNRKTSNILSVIRSDMKRLSRSAVAVVCVMGLVLIPCLYSWFNVLSNWNPYIEESTRNLNIGVVSNDVGSTIAGFEINCGTLMVKELKANEQVGWQFPESEEALMDGLYAGDYYAALIIPADFSERVVSFKDGKFIQPEIIYYDNQKLNAVASRVTDRAQTVIKDRVNEIFVSLIVDRLSDYTALFDGMGIDANSALRELESSLASVQNDLRTYSSIMDSMSSVTQSAATVSGMTGDLLPDIADMLVKCRTSIGDMQERLETSKEDVIYAADSIRNTAEELKNTADRLDNAVGGDPADAGKAYVDWSSLYGETGITVYEGEILDDLYYDVNNHLHESYKELDSIIKETNIDGNLIASMTTLQDSLNNLDSLLEKMQGNVEGQQITLAQYTNALNSCTNSINQTKDVLDYMANAVASIQSSVSTLRNSENFSKILDLFDSDVDGLIAYLDSPANLEVVRVYELENNGSGMAPFYTILSIYASALLSVSIMNTHVKRKEEFGDLSVKTEFMGRYFTFFAIGQATALVTVLGNLFYIGIQCYNPLLYWLAAAIASFLFTIINYGLVFAFGNIGEALSIVILVIQVAGSGGTYPVQMLPEFFQKLYSVMPFNFAMNAMRETISGAYGNTYLRCVLIMLATALVLIPVFILCSVFYRPVRERFETSKARTKLMH